MTTRFQEMYFVDHVNNKRLHDSPIICMPIILSKCCVMLPGASVNVNPGVLMLWNGKKGNITHVLWSLGT